LVDEKCSRCKTTKVKTNYLVPGDEQDLYSRVFRVKPVRDILKKPKEDDLELGHGSKDEKDKRSNLGEPIRQATEGKEKVDTFIIFTTSIQSEIKGDPYKDFQAYQRSVNPRAKLIICAMETNPEVIADPNDPSVKVFCGADGYLLFNIITFMHPERFNEPDACKFCCLVHAE